MPPDVLIAGCGDLGCALGKRLVAEGLQVTGLRLSNAPLPDGIRTVQADVTQAQTLSALSGLQPAILVYCIAASAQTDENYRTHYVEGLRNVLDALGNAAGLRHVFFVSSTRVYGQKTAELLDETTPALPADFGGERLLEAEALLAGLPCPGTALRLSGIYGPGRTRLLALAREPAAWPAQNSWTNRIHRDDAAAFIAFLIGRVLEREPVDDVYLVTDNRPAPQYEVLQWLAEQLGVAGAGIVPPSPLAGKRLDNARMRGTGFELRYPDYRAGYADEVRKFLGPAAPPSSGSLQNNG